MDDAKKDEDWHCCIAAEEMQRPILSIEECQRPDGSYVVDMKRQAWTAVVFKASIDPYDFTEKIFGRVTLVHGGESWYFYNAKIALLPSAGAPNLSCGHFVMVYDSCARVTEEHEPQDT